MKRDLSNIVFITRPLAVLRTLASPEPTPQPPPLKGRGSHAVTGVGLLLLLSALALPRGIMAQTYDIPTSMVGGGGSTATGASYSLTGTVGQPAAE